MKPYFGPYGGQFVPETLMPAVKELESAFNKYKSDKKFSQEFNDLLKNYAGRPTPLTFCPNLSKKLNLKLYLKREDLAHTGAHKINNALGQALLAKYMGKTRIIAETGAGQHGVATATAAAKLGLKCDIYMGSVDIERQKPNVHRMKLLGAKVIPVDSGSKTLKDAINEALRDWTSTVETTHYLLGSVLGPHPYPSMVRDFLEAVSISLLACCNFCWVLSRITPNFPNSCLTTLSNDQTSLALFSTAKVLNPICKLLSRAAIVVGPAIIIL